jgi:hypothetical protein
LKNVTSLKNVPYLDLANCRNTEDFSSLGMKQRFLRLSSCTNVTDADVERFANVPCLHVSRFHGITRISVSFGNRYLDAFSCSQLIEVNLQGSQFIHVNLNDCEQLMRLNIEGKVQYLDVTDCSRLDCNALDHYDFLRTKDKIEM